MPIATGHAAGCALEPLLGREHGAAGEAPIAASVRAECDQLGRAAHGRHHPVELLLPFAVPVHEHCEVPRREGRLAVGDGVERENGIGEQLLAIGAGDLAMLVDPLQLQPLSRHPRGGRTDLVLRRELDALRVQRAVIDTRVDVERGQPCIHMPGPALAPLLQQRGPVPVADLGAEPVRAHLAHRQHHMGVRLCQPMDIQIGDHPAGDELTLDEVPG